MAISVTPVRPAPPKIEQGKDNTSAGSVLGTVLGGAAGAIIGGPAGALTGASLGGSIGGAAGSLTSKAPTQGEMQNSPDPVQDSGGAISKRLEQMNASSSLDTLGKGIAAAQDPGVSPEVRNAVEEPLKRAYEMERQKFVGGRA